MSDINVTPEDRERIVDMRFAELLRKHLATELPPIFDQRLMEWAALATPTSDPGQQPRRATHSQPLPPSEGQPRPRRRSAFDIALAQALGMS